MNHQQKTIALSSTEAEYMALSNCGCQLACYDSVTLGLIKEKNLVLGLTQENSIENSIQDCLPYILKPHGLCYY